MKTVLKALGVLLVLVAVLIGGAATFFVRMGPKIDADSKAYVDATIPILVSDWNPKELTSRSSRELLAVANEAKLTDVYADFRKLGELKQYRGSKGEASLWFNMPTSVVTTAAYVATADFENGQAKIKMSLVWRDGRWQISELRIDSPVLRESGDS
jgi:hypothetical protein